VTQGQPFPSDNLQTMRTIIVCESSERDVSEIVLRDLIVNSVNIFDFCKHVIDGTGFDVQWVRVFHSPSSAIAVRCQNARAVQKLKSWSWLLRLYDDIKLLSKIWFSKILANYLWCFVKLKDVADSKSIILSSLDMLNSWTQSPTFQHLLSSVHQNPVKSEPF